MSADNTNPFDLTKLIPTGGLVEKQGYRPEIFTTDEQKNMLKDFKLVPKEKWLQLQIGTQIRYIRKDGEMRKGGYIQYIDPKGEFMSISLTEIDQRQSKHWRLPLNGVAEIWCADANASAAASFQKMSSAPTSNPDINETIASIKEDIRQLKIEIQRVMNQQKRIIKSVGINAVRLDRIEGAGRY